MIFVAFHVKFIILRFGSEDYWDRTEAQARGSLHSHVLVWFRQKLRPTNWEPLPPVDKRSPGVDAKQRPLNQTVPKLDTFQEDSLYQLAHLGRISGEMPRADVSSAAVKWGGYTFDSLRVAGLARSVLIKLGYCHSCTPHYCLLNRSTCTQQSRLVGCGSYMRPG